MADVEKIVKFVLKWETGTTEKSTETPEQMFERARKKGFVNDPLDRGGATQSGLTLTAYKNYCKKHNISSPTVDNLKNIPYKTWKAVLKEDYWDKLECDRIVCQSIANILFDFAWASGSVTAAKKIQGVLGCVQDGIVGNKTLTAINSKSPLSLFAQIKQMRIDFVNAIVKNNPSQKKWLKGWTNRINDIKWVG